ncbi:MAG: sensor histidine kinase, partial [Treponema sp.]|nr:sensor histidine kinase [Treponema sp.]
YTVLLFALIFFVALCSVLIFFLKKELARSLGREKDGTLFSHSYMLAQDEERSRISRELHDTVIQDMRFLLLETEKIGCVDETRERKKLIGEATGMISGIIRGARDICNGLIPPDFRFSELPDALRQLCLDFGAKTGIDCRAEIDGDVRLDFTTVEKRLQVFRIVQEALANIEKHSGAKEAVVTMRQTLTGGEGGTIYLGISDDGNGFVPPLDGEGQIKPGIDKSHIGIISMKERAAILGGRLKIESEVGQGTLIRVELPTPPPPISKTGMENR